MDPLTDWLTGWGAGCTLPPAPDCLLCLLTLLLCLLELSQFLPLFVSLSCLYVILLLSLCYAPSISLCLPIYRDAFSKAFLYFTTTVAESTTRITSGQSLLFFFTTDRQTLSEAEAKEYTVSIKAYTCAGFAAARSSAWCPLSNLWTWCSYTASLKPLRDCKWPNYVLMLWPWTPKPQSLRDWPQFSARCWTFL